MPNCSDFLYRYSFGFSGPPSGLNLLLPGMAVAYLFALGFTTPAACGCPQLLGDYGCEILVCVCTWRVNCHQLAVPLAHDKLMAMS